MWDGRNVMPTPSPNGLLDRPIQRGAIIIQANGQGTSQTLSGSPNAVASDGTSTQFKDATGQYQNITGDFNRNGWRQQADVDPQTGVQFTARCKTPAAWPVGAVGRWLYGLVVQGFGAANPSTVQGMAFRFDRFVGDMNWMAVCRGPAGEAEQDTGVLASLNTRYDFGFIMVTGALTFYVNDVRVARFTSDLPTELLRMYGNVESDGAVATPAVRNAFLQVIWGINA